jgi:hypothetical protein
MITQTSTFADQQRIDKSYWLQHSFDFRVTSGSRMINGARQTQISISEYQNNISGDLSIFKPF